jgi:hypothetical protein
MDTLEEEKLMNVNGLKELEFYLAAENIIKEL